MTNIIHTLSKVRAACHHTGARFIVLRDDEYFYVVVVAHGDRRYRFDLIGDESSGQIAYSIRKLIKVEGVVK